MLKLIAALRTVATAVVLFLMLRASPLWADPRLTCDEQRLYYYRSSSGLLFACGLAVVWLAAEAGVTWFRIVRRSRKAAAAPGPTP